MDSPIVSPWFFYLLGVMDAINFYLGLVIVVGILIGVVFFVVGMMHREEYGSEDEDAKYWFSKTKLIAKCLSILLFLHIIIPAKSTMLQMIVASYITPANLELAIKAGVDFKEMVKEDFIEVLSAVQDATPKE